MVLNFGRNDTGVNAIPQNVFTYLLVQNALQNMMDGMIGLYS